MSIAAVALSVSLLVVVASLFDGFIRAFERSAVETVGDVVFSAPVKFSKYPLFVDRLEQLGSVDAATATLSSEGLLHLGKGNVRPVKIWGIEPARRAKVTGYKDSLLRQKNLPGEPAWEIPGRADAIGGFVGIGVIGEPDEKTDEYDFDAAEDMFGRSVVLTTGSVTEQANQSSGEPTRQFKRRTTKFTVADVVFTGVYELDKRLVYLPIEQMQDILYPDEDGRVADQIQIKLSDGADAASAVAQITGLWRAFVNEQLDGDLYLMRSAEVKTAIEMQSLYVTELRKQMGVLLLIFGVVSFSVVVLVFCIFYMIVTTKRKDIAIIKSCGSSGNSVAVIFVGFGLCVGVIGSAAGLVLGDIITRNVNIIEEWIRIVFGLKLWSSSVYMFSRIPNEVDWSSAATIVLFAIAAAAVGTLIPAVVAARTKPVDILRYE